MPTPPPERLPTAGNLTDYLDCVLTPIVTINLKNSWPQKCSKNTNKIFGCSIHRIEGTGVRMTTTPPVIPLIDHLRSVTWQRHTEFEQLPFVISLIDGTLPLESYIAQLRGLAVILSAFEQALANCRHDLIKRLRPLLKSRFAMLCADLSHFAPRMVPDIVAAIDIAQKISLQMLSKAGASPGVLLGCLYVLEGTTRGNQVHLPDIIRCFSIKDGAGVSFYRGYGDATATHWDELRQVFNDAGAELFDDAVKGTIDIYNGMERFHRALLPIPAGGLGFTASALNPEAGNHPVPQDQDILQAALRAGQQCRNEFSYYEKRYGERGRRFTASDVAWLATLADELEVEIIYSQVVWLGRFLSSRGMPQFLLERQLELLVEELAGTKTSASTEALQAAVTRMRRQRHQLLPQERFDEACRELRVTIADTSITDFPDLPKLLVASHLDTLAGMPESKALIFSWLNEKSILSEQELNRAHGILDRLSPEFGEPLTGASYA